MRPELLLPLLPPTLVIARATPGAGIPYTQAAEPARTALGEDRSIHAGEHLQVLAWAEGLSSRQAGVQNIGD